ncbi:9436_t:CDS:2, partial [Racocetra persica]
GQPDLNTILTVLNQLQLDNQTLHQENAELRDALNQFRIQGVDNKYKEPKPNCYPDDRTQVGLLGSLLTGSALAWFAPLLEKQSKLLEDFGELVKEFEATFGDADKQIASDLDWGEAALVDQFRTGGAPAVVRRLRLDQDISLNPKILSSYSSNALTPKLSLHLPGGSEVKIVALVDSGASACFLDTTFAQECNIPIYKKELPFSVEVIDGRKISSGNVTHETGPLLVYLQGHYENMLFNLILSPII